MLTSDSVCYTHYMLLSHCACHSHCSHLYHVPCHSGFLLFVARSAFPSLPHQTIPDTIRSLLTDRGLGGRAFSHLSTRPARNVRPAAAVTSCCAAGNRRAPCRAAACTWGGGHPCSGTSAGDASGLRPAQGLCGGSRQALGPHQSAAPAKDG
jgi:hypothetical protein